MPIGINITIRLIEMFILGIHFKQIIMKTIVSIAMLSLLSIAAKAQTPQIINNTSCSFTLKIHCIPDGMCDINTVGGPIISVPAGSTQSLPNPCGPTPPPFSVNTSPVYELIYNSPVNPDCASTPLIFGQYCDGYTYKAVTPCCGDLSKFLQIKYTANGIEIFQ